MMRVSSLRVLVVVALVGGAAACTPTSPSAETASPNPSARRESVRTLDLEKLVGRNIDQIRRVLGAPTETREQSIGLEPTSEQMRATKGEDWINTFERDGNTVVVTFNARTRKVRDMVLLGSNENELMRRGNLSLVSEDYMVLPVGNPTEPSKIIGVRVVPRR